MEKSPDAFRTISEVAEWLETPAHVLRFWESRFTQLKPIKRAGGRRYYRPGDMALLGGIKKLLHEDGLTIRGVQKILREQGVRYVATLSAVGQDPSALLGLILEHEGIDVGSAGGDRDDEAAMAADVPQWSPTAGDPSNVVRLGTLAAVAPFPGEAFASAGDPVPLAEAPQDAAYGDAGELSDEPPPGFEEEWAALLAEEAARRFPKPPASGDAGSGPLAVAGDADAADGTPAEPAPETGGFASRGQVGDAVPDPDWLADPDPVGAAQTFDGAVADSADDQEQASLQHDGSDSAALTDAAAPQTTWTPPEPEPNHVAPTEAGPGDVDPSDREEDPPLQPPHVPEPQDGAGSAGPQTAGAIPGAAREPDAGQEPDADTEPDASPDGAAAVAAQPDLFGDLPLPAEPPKPKAEGPARLPNRRAASELIDPANQPVPVASLLRRLHPASGSPAMAHLADRLSELRGRVANAADAPRE